MFSEEVLRPGAAVASHLDLGELTRRYDAHRAGTTDQSHALWAVWVLERWLSTVNAAPTAAPALPRAETLSNR